MNEKTIVVGGEAERLRALIRKHLPVLRLIDKALAILAPTVLTRLLIEDAIRDFEREAE